MLWCNLVQQIQAWHLKLRCTDQEKTKNHTHTLIFFPKIVQLSNRKILLTFTLIQTSVKHLTCVSVLCGRSGLNLRKLDQQNQQDAWQQQQEAAGGRHCVLTHQLTGSSRLGTHCSKWTETNIKLESQEDKQPEDIRGKKKKEYSLKYDPVWKVQPMLFIFLVGTFYFKPFSNQPKLTSHLQSQLTWIMDAPS